MDIRIAFDTNNWISFTIGKKLAQLENILLDEYIQTFLCEQIQSEYLEVIKRPKLAKYLSLERVLETLKLMKVTCQWVVLTSPIDTISRDKDDDYLLTLCKDASLDYLVTGDKDLLILESFQETKILNFQDFCTIYEQQITDKE